MNITLPNGDKTPSLELVELINVHFFNDIPLKDFFSINVRV